MQRLNSKVYATFLIISLLALSGCEGLQVGIEVPEEQSTASAAISIELGTPQRKDRSWAEAAGTSESSSQPARSSELEPITTITSEVTEDAPATDSLEQASLTPVTDKESEPTSTPERVPTEVVPTIGQPSPVPTSTVRPSDSLLTIPLNIDGVKFYPRSLTFDGTDLWVGGYDRDLAVRVRTGDGAILQVVPLAKWGVGVPDMAFDGVHVWAPVKDSIIKVRASDGQVLDTYYFDFDSAEFTPLSLTFDGTDLWVGGRNRDLAIRMRTSDGAILQVISLAKWGVGVPDIAFDGMNVWALVKDSVIKVRASDGQVLDTYYLNFDSAGFMPSSLTFDGTDLWVGAHNRDLVVRMRTSDGTILQIVELAKTGAGVPAITFDGMNVLAIVKDRLAKVHISDGYKSLQPVGQGASSLVFDGTFFWVANTTDGTLTRGQ